MAAAKENTFSCLRCKAITPFDVCNARVSLGTMTGLVCDPCFGAICSIRKDGASHMAQFADERVAAMINQLNLACTPKGEQPPPKVAAKDVAAAALASGAQSAATGTPAAHPTEPRVDAKQKAPAAEAANCSGCTTPLPGMVPEPCGEACKSASASPPLASPPKATAEASPSAAAAKCMNCKKQLSATDRWFCGNTCKRAFGEKEIASIDACLNALEGKTDQSSEMMRLQAECWRISLIASFGFEGFKGVFYGGKKFVHLLDRPTKYMGFFGPSGAQTFIGGLPVLKGLFTLTRNGVRPRKADEARRLRPLVVDEITRPDELVAMFTPRSLATDDLAYIIEAGQTAEKVYMASDGKDKSAEGVCMAIDAILQVFLETQEEAPDDTEQEKLKDKATASVEASAATATAAAPPAKNQSAKNSSSH